MTTHAKRIIEPQEREFHTEQVVTIAFGHLTHDVYTAFIAPLLPLIIEKLSLSLTMAGTLTAIMQIPSVLNPFIGYLADRISLRYFVILAPAASATLMSLMGLAPNTISLALILFLTGVSSAAFHSPAPAMIGRISGDQIGKGMSFFMAAGELARSLGPLFAVWAASTWTLEGYYPVMILGWGASLLLFWRLHEISGRTEKRGDWRALTKMIRSFFLPLLFIVLARIFLQVCLGTYLPTLMTMEGSTLWIAGVSLAILEAAGVVGALTSGMLSDRYGRKPALLVAFITSSLLTWVFLNIQGWLLIPTLILLGFTALSTGPVLLALVQDQFPSNRAVANGVYITMSFLLRSLASLLVGVAGDAFGLRSVFSGSALIALISIPAIYTLPKPKK
jgi:FSR family fosmidomycin resistance protein-like MFS transporter